MNCRSHFRLLVLAFAWTSAFTSQQGFAAEKATVRPDRIIVKYKAAAKGAPVQAQAVRTSVGARLHRRYDRLGGIEVLNFNSAAAATAAIRQLKASGEVEYVEPDYLVYPSATPNDPRYTDGSLWGLHNTGQRSGTNDADIDAPEAWDTLRDAPNIIVAVIDTGVRYTHEDLAANMWRNPGETAGNGIDDDGNGLVDDVFGINAIAGTGNPMDDHGHGTHCAGTIGGVGNNGKGVAGVAWRVQIMACKFLPAVGGGSTSDAIECINYAVSKGAHILSNSWGGGGFANALNDAIASARAAGIIFVAAAGNESKDNDVDPNYPSGYAQDNVISVASSTRTEGLSDFSNFGRTTVDIAAPGSDILSTIHTSDSAYGEKSGTSMATPQVAGALALLKVRFPGETYRQLIQRLFNSADRMPAFSGRSVTGARMNLSNALTGSSSRPINDPLAGATEIPGSRFVVDGSNLSATKEAGEPTHGGNTGGASVWWKWTAQAAGPVTLTTEGSGFNTLLGVYTGSAVGSLNLVASNDNASGGVTWSSVSFTAVEGMTYRIAVDGFGGATGDIVLNGDGPSSVPNDDFLDRLPLNGASFAQTGSSTEATKEPGEPNHASNRGGRSVWWTWTAPASGPVTVKTLGSSFDTLLAIYTGSSLGGLTSIISNDDAASGGLTSEVTFTATAGVAYQIAVDGYNDASGTIALQGSGTAPILPTVTVAASDSNSGEGGDTGAFTVSRVGSNSTALVVNLARTGTAGSGTDYTPLPSTVTIAAGATAATLTVTPTDDSITEESETVILTVSPAAQYITGSPDSATVTIADNDTAAAVTVEASDSSAGEASGDSGSFTLRRTGSTTEELSINVQISGSAASGIDYAALSTPVTIPAGQSVALLTITPVDDLLPELTETVTLIVAPGSNYIVGAPATASVSIVDNDSTTNNDNFAQRATLAGSSFSTAGSTAASTKEPGEPNHAAITGGKSVWYQWLAPTSGATVIDTFGSQFDTLLAIYTGTALASLTPIASNDDAVGSGGVNSQVTFQATAGVTYLVAIDGYRGASGNFVLNGSAPSSSLPVVTIESTVPATAEGAAQTGSMRISRTEATASALQINLTVSGSATNGTDYSAVPTIVNIPAGSTTVNIPITAVDDSFIEASESVVIAVGPSPSYVTGLPASATVTIADNDVSSDNDNFANAVPLNGTGFVVSGSNTTATKEAGEPNHAGNAGGKSVWWRWTAPESDSYTMNTSGSDFDTLLAVYVGESVGALRIVASNDDSGGLTSQLTFSAVAGESYLIAVDGYGGGSGGIVLSSGPGGGGELPHDSFVARRDLGIGNFSDTSNSEIATRELGEPELSGERTVWWTWTPAATGTAVIQTAGSSFDTILAVYTGTTLEALSMVELNDDDGKGLTSLVTFEAQANTTYQISVGAYLSSGGGDVVLTGRIDPFAGVLGAYHGLVSSVDGAAGLLGSFLVKVSKDGRFTGKLIYEGESFRFKGFFDETGYASVVVASKFFGDLFLSLQLDVSSGSDQIYGSISDDFGGGSYLLADRAVFDKRDNPAPQAGTYTLLISPAGDGVNGPGGLGSGSLVVKPDGSGRFAGTLGDGTKVSQRVQLSKDGVWPFHVELYRSQGVISGFLFFEDRPGESDISGALSWRKPGGVRGKTGSAPFATDVWASGSYFNAPPRGIPVLDFGQRVGNAQLSFGQSDLAAPLDPISATLTANNAVVVDRSQRLKMKMNGRSGTFRGSVGDPSSGRALPFSGAVFQKLNYGAGFFFGESSTGELSFDPTAIVVP
ncbi:MAG: peptidase and in kexin sedolisin [Chthoniobacter sp.]|nr:peptidase and in kexin sedolisin [Chthoniobacter sp.]